MKVICISGKAQHGKDTTAGMMKTALESIGHTVLIAHYGDLLWVERRKRCVWQKFTPEGWNRHCA